MSKRQDIRDALVAILATPVNDVYPTQAGENVYANRSAHLWRSELPLIMIYARNESAIRRSLNSAQSIRTLQLSIEIHAEANEDLDDTLDEISREVEDLIGADTSLSGTTQGTDLKDTEMSLDSDGERQVGKLTLTFETKYIE